MDGCQRWRFWTCERLPCLCFWRKFWSFCRAFWLSITESYRYLRLKKNIPQTLVRTDVFSQHAPRAWQEKSSGELGKKNQTNAGRVSQYTSPLQRNVSLFSQAIGLNANKVISWPSRIKCAPFYRSNGRARSMALRRISIPCGGNPAGIFSVARRPNSST